MSPRKQTQASHGGVGSPGSQPISNQSTGTTERGRQRLAGWRRWVFPLAAAVFVPALLLTGVELALRAARYGYPPDFFVPIARDAYTTNQRYGWRFFPRAVARTPVVTRLTAEKGSDTYRVFVLGGSAAMGTPDPAFGFARILEVMLRESYPDRRFEVVNAAMTAIDSHVVLDIAKACARHAPDLFVVYLGNNEVVGPHGPGTVFGGFSPNLSLVRLGMWVRTLRIGQALAATITPRQAGPDQWRGLEMFLDRQLAADDPRLETVYRHLRRNLRDLAEVARRSGARLLLSTIATNLETNPPFASRHRRDLTDSERATWRAHVDGGAASAAAGRHAAAVAAFQEAMRLDDQVAELHYRLARVYQADGRADQARRHFVRARDLDGLRFRADTTINEIIREVAEETGTSGVLFVDAEQALARPTAHSEDVGGSELFYEHVHLRFPGSYRLARAVFDKVHDHLQGSTDTPAVAPPPSPRRSAELLALTDWDRHQSAFAIYQTAKRPPFTNQLDHDARQRARRQATQTLNALSRQGLERVERIHRDALLRAPGDLFLTEKLAYLLEERGAWAEAAALWRDLSERVPGVLAWDIQLGFALLEQGQSDAALAQMRRVVESWPRSALASVNLGRVFEQRGQIDAADQAFRRALDLNPSHELARLKLGALLAQNGRLDQANTHYREALRIVPESAEAHFGLGTVLERQHELAEAESAYAQAVRVDPDLVKARNNLGYVLQQQGRHAEAIEAYRAAAQVDPLYTLAHFNLADALLAQGDVEGAVEAYRTGLAVSPDNQAARVNLAAALQLLGRSSGAATQYRLVLARQADATRALHGLAWILATADDPALRDAREAVRLAEEANRLSGGKTPEVLEALAVAYARAGDTDKAVQTTARAIELARAEGKEALVARLTRRAADAAPARRRADRKPATSPPGATRR